MRFGTGIGYDIIERTIIIAGFPLAAKAAARFGGVVCAAGGIVLPIQRAGHTANHLHRCRSPCGDVGLQMLTQQSTKSL
jgi:hypothetical protein